MGETDLEYLRDAAPELVKAWELCEKATKGPWTPLWVPSKMPTDCCEYGAVRPDGRETVRVWERNDVEFVAESRTALPLALSLVIKMGKEAEESEARCEKLRIEANCGGVSIGEKCTSPLEPGHEIFGCMYGDGAGGFVCELHHFRTLLATAEATIAELRGALEAYDKAAILLTDQQLIDNPQLMTAIANGRRTSEQVGGK